MRMLVAVASARIDPAAAAHAMKLKEYWAFGDGAKKWATWTELRRHLAKYVHNPHELDGLTQNVYRMRYHRNPPHGKKKGKE